jgi:hypothetical protein
MRILTKKEIWRAFPELDRYSDDQCRRFVNSARGTWLRRCTMVTLCAVAALLVCTLCIAMGILVVSRLRSDGSVRWPDAIGLTTTVPLICFGIALVLPFFVYLLTRDVLLRRRIRNIIRVRGVCGACGYSLLGLAVSPSNRVVCPECAVDTEVDPSLGDLAIDATGKPRYQPTRTEAEQPRLLTPRRMRIIKRTALITVIALPLLLLSAWGIYEWFLSNQAARARKLRPGLAALNAHVLQVQPQDTTSQDQNAFDWLAVATRTRTEVEFAFQGKAKLLIPDTKATADVTMIDFDGKYSDDPDLRKQEEDSRTLGLALMEDLRASSLFDELDALARAPRAIRSLIAPPNQPAMNIMLPDLSFMRALARINAVRMHQAREKGDMKEWLRAHEANLALTRMSLSQCTLIDGLVGIAINALNNVQVRKLLETHPDDATLEAILAARARQSPPPLSHALKGEEIATTDNVYWLFSEPKQVRGGRFNPSLKALTGGSYGTSFHKKLGTLNQNLTEFNDFFATAQARVEQTPFAFDQAHPNFQEDVQTDLLLLSVLAFATSKTANNSWQNTLDNTGLETMIALERYRNAHADYPQTLDQLVPAYLPALPQDPWSDQPLRYKRIDPVQDPHRRAYLLYSVAADGKDNGGVRMPETQFPLEALQRSHKDSSYDFILNDPKR